MAQNIFEQYGIKEVADVQFEALEADTRLGVAQGDVVLYLDTLKVSTIETSAEQTEAKGGRGNTSLIIWDYGREVTLNITDALFSPASLAVMMGGAGVEAGDNSKITVRYTQDVDSFTASGEGATKLDHVVKNSGNSTNAQYVVRFLNMTKGIRGQVSVATDGNSATLIAALTGAKIGTGDSAPSAIAVGDKLKLFYDVEIDGTSNSAAYQITIDSETFPGTYKVYGDTVVRNTNGKDTAFQFVIPKAKIGSSVNFSMEAEGDPTTFEMSLRVMRTDDHEMLKLIKYEMPTT